MKLTPMERAEIIGELELKTGYGFDYLNKQTDEKLLQILKERG